MRVTPIYFRFHICVQTFITIERIIKIFFGRAVPLNWRVVYSQVGYGWGVSLIILNQFCGFFFLRCGIIKVSF